MAFFLEASAGGEDGVGMNLDGVGGVAGVTPGESNGDGDFALAGGVEDNAVALLQAFHRQGQAAELVLAVGGGAGGGVDQGPLGRESVVEGKEGDSGGDTVIKKKK